MLRTSLAVLIVVGLSGCGGSEISRVIGSVCMDDEPLLEVNVTFWPKNDPGLGILSALGVDDDGGFDIRPDPHLGPGKAGTYLVMITDRQLMQAFAALANGTDAKSVRCPQREKLIPKKFTQRHSTPLVVEIARGVNELDPFELVSDPPSKRPLFPRSR